MLDHHVLLYQLAAAKTKTAHKRAIHESTPAAGKALTYVALELTRHGHGPTDNLAKVQLGLLVHPDSTHEDFKKAAENQTGGGLGQFLAGMAKGLLGPVIGIDKAIFGHPAARVAAKEAASRLFSHAVDKAKAAAAAKLAAKA